MFRSKNKKNKTGLFAILGLVFIIGFSILISNLTAPEVAEVENIEFKKVTFTEYESFFNEENKGLVFVYVGSPACGHCVRIQPLLKTLEEEQQIVFNYLNVSEMTEEEMGKFPSTSKTFEGQWGTPTLLAIVNGKEISNVSGYREIEELRTFVTNAKSALTNE